MEISWAPVSNQEQPSRGAMINLAFSTSIRKLPYPSIALHRGYHIGKAGSVHTAIQRGLRKSNGSGFRGTERGPLSPGDSRERYRVQHGIAEYQHPLPNSDPRPIQRHSKNKGGVTSRLTAATYDKAVKLYRHGKIGVPDEEGSRWERSKASKPQGLRKRLVPEWNKRGKVGARDEEGSRWERSGASKQHARLRTRRIVGKEEHSGDYTQRTSRYGRTYAERDSRHFEGREKVSDKGSRPFKDLNKGVSGSERSLVGRSSHRSERLSELPSTRSLRRSAYGDSYGSRYLHGSSESSDRYPSLSFGKGSSGSKFRNSTSNSGGISYRSTTELESPSSNHSIRYGDRYSFDMAVEFPTKRNEASSSSGPRFIQTTDNRIPLSIPFTTPASEFLYGTSVVEAALSSRREPRRKLYKLYIYTGENREEAGQDVNLEKLARKNYVDVVRVGKDWLRVMDKMSAGRPHNGYILEASPLPRLPVKSLGQLTTQDNQDGFEVSIDYQSREEAAVNGTSNFIKIVRSRDGRKPLVLLLDSIVDPGNLGGIIRTASFLGVTAIAISTRNSASFTPVVLKASAGASEDVTLFTVSKPAGFVIDSKSAGWKTFAAVAPAKKDDPAMPASLSTDELNDPLSKDPCILMLGSEGEGLRWNLRSKADVDLYIEGSRRSNKVDSLNVSVAAGILCNSFLGRSKPAKVTPFQQEQDKEAPKTLKLF